MVERSDMTSTNKSEKGVGGPCGKLGLNTSLRLRLVLTVLVAAVLLLIFVGFSAKYLGTCPLKPSENIDKNLSSWMSIIDDSVNLSSVVIPGAHDAATEGMSWMAETQMNGVDRLLQLGVRYLDLRFAWSEEKLLAFHGAEISDDTECEQVVGHIRDFLIQNPTECILLDFQHFKNGAEDRVLEVINRELRSKGLLIENTSGDPQDAQFVAALKMRDCRGKAVVFWGNRDEKYLNEPFLFGRNDDGCTYEGMSLNSKYIGALNKKSSKDFIETGIDAYVDSARRLAMKNERGEIVGKPVFVLQCQLTDGLLFRGPWYRHKSHGENLKKYIDTLPGQADLNVINVILQDFIGVEEARSVILLNVYKKNIDPDNTAAFYDVAYGA